LFACRSVVFAACAPLGFFCGPPHSLVCAPESPMARFGSHFFSTSHTFFFGLLHICRPCRSTFFCCFPKYFFACGSLGFFFSLSFIFWPCLAYGTISGPQVSAFLPCVRLLPPYGSIFFFLLVCGSFLVFAVRLELMRRRLRLDLLAHNYYYLARLWLDGCSPS
jgi:hypothetical protein